MRPTSPEPSPDRKARLGVQRIGGLVEIPAVLSENSADAAAVFHRAGLRLSDFTDPETRTAYANIGRLVSECAAATNLEHFGLLAGARWRLNHLGVLGGLIGLAPNLGAGLRAGSAHQWLNAYGGVAFVRESEDVARVGYGVYLGDVTHTDYLYDLALAFEVAILREMLGDLWRPSSVLLPRSKPADPMPYREFFGAPVEFGASVAALRFPATTLSRRLPDGNPARWRDAMRDVEGFGTAELATRVRRAIRVMLTTNGASAEELAEMLAMHRRTLDRRLRDAGTSFRSELDHVRFAVAQQMLSTTASPLEDIAPALGYAEPSPFVRAFTRWTGMSPTRWRKLNSTGSARV